MLLYRYTSRRSEDWENLNHIELHEYTVVRESDHSYWISTNQWFPEITKIVRKNARKTFAYTTKQKALYAYIKRTTVYKRILTDNLRIASEWLQEAESLYDNLYP